MILSSVKELLIDTQAMVCPGKTIGEKSHVAAYSVVTHDVPSFVRVVRFQQE